MKKRKLAWLTVSGMLVVALAVSGATLALFTSSASNSGNTFETGNLELSTHRHDVPIEGPMFYTYDSDDGRMGTGEWAPRDINTRAMLIKNTGSLDAKLSRLYAIPESENADDFSEQAIVTIAVLDGPGDLAPDVIRLANEAIDREYKDLMSQGWLGRLAGRTVQEFAAEVRKAFLHLQFEVDGHNFFVKDVYTGTLAGLMNNGTSALEDLELPRNRTMYMAYTVTLPDHENNNAVQGQDIRFTFKSEFVQSKNN